MSETAAKLLLINPRMCKPSSARFPLSLLNLAAVLDGRHDYRIIDGNVEPDAVSCAAAQAEGCTLAAITVMPGPQVQPAIDMSRAIRRANPEVSIVWGGYFPTMYPDAAINADYVDYLIRGQGEDTLMELLDQLAGPSAADPQLDAVDGLTWKHEGRVIHNHERGLRPPHSLPQLPYERLGDLTPYLRPSFMGARTGVHQAAIGCRYRCGFCGVATVFNGTTHIPPEQRFERDLARLAATGADSVQYYDNNFFDREANYMPLLEVMARRPLPWWSYARADALANAPTKAWELMRRSGLRMVYIGAESASDAALKRMKKGSVVAYTFETVRRCREAGIIPELSFVLGGPEDPEAEIEQSFATIRALKAIHPQAEIILYIYSPTPQRGQRGQQGHGDPLHLPVLDSYGPQGPSLPDTPQGWTEQRWLDYVCHQDAPWLSPRVRQRIRDFARVVECRFPTVQDLRTPAWGKLLLRALASWRYATRSYDGPIELELAQRFIRVRQPQRESL